MNTKGFLLTEPELPNPILGFDNFGHADLKDIVNFRDLGGMPTSDGRHIKPHTLLRSGELHHAHKDVLDTLIEEYDVMRIVDLRTPQERSAQPDPIEKMESCEYIPIPVFDENAFGIANGGGLASEVRSMLEISNDPFSLITKLYSVAFIDQQGMDSFRFIMNMLLEADEGSTLWHCTEGKDRTGMLAMLVEFALGVPEEFIFADYLATNLFVAKGRSSLVDFLGGHHILTRVGADVDAMLYAQRDYIDAALEAIRKNYGSVGGYLEDAMGFDNDAIDELRDKYLTH